MVVEDERNLAKLLRGYLEREGFEVREAFDGEAVLAAAREAKPEVVVLDWMLPGLDGLEVLRELRRFSNAYVIMLTARVEEVDRIVGLSSGADDYLTKPFSPGELVARVRAMLRRPRGAPGEARAPEGEPLGSGELEIDPGAREVRFGGEGVPLTTTEFDLLATLQGYMEGLMEGVVEPSDETWALLYGEAERMRRLVDDLRQLSRAEAGQLKLDVAAVSPEELVRTATERMLPLFQEKGVELSSKVPEGLPPVLADGDRAVQVLTNPLGNALRHTPTGGRVAVA